MMTPEERKKHKLEYHRKWRKNNPEKIREYNKKEYSKKSHKKYVQENKEKINEKNKKWRADNPEKVKEYEIRSFIKRVKRAGYTVLDKYGSEV